MFSLKGKKAIVTGAGSGIGQAIATILAKQGAEVHIIELGTEQASATLQKIKTENGIAFTYACDVANHNAVTDTFNKIGKIEILINNAGISMRSMFETVDLKVLKQVMDINFWGSVYCTKAALPFITQNKGVIVGVSSIAGYRGLPGRSGGNHDRSGNVLRTPRGWASDRSCAWCSWPARCGSSASWVASAPGAPGRVRPSPARSAPVP